jgi:hypothetical protein
VSRIGSEWLKTKIVSSASWSHRARLFQRTLRLYSFRNVAGDFGVANRYASRVPDRVNDHMRTEVRAILTDAQRLLLKPPFPGRRFERLCRLAVLSILLRVKPGECWPMISSGK